MIIAQTPIVTVARMTKFTRAGVLARSLKLQRQQLANAREAIAAGNVLFARALLASWNTERRAYKLALAWQTL